MTEQVLTTTGFSGLYSRHGFTRAQKGSRAALNDILHQQASNLTKLGMLQADHENRVGLSRNHAEKAVEMMPEIPKGIY